MRARHKRSFHSISSKKTTKDSCEALNEQEAEMTREREVLLLDREDEENGTSSTANDEKKLKYRGDMEEKSRSAESRKGEEKKAILKTEEEQR